MKNNYKWIYLLVLLLSMTGCWDKKEVDKKAHITVIGLDKSEQKNRILVTYLITNPEFGTREGGANREPVREVMSFTTDDFISSKDIANTLLSREVTYDILSAIVISEDLASDDHFIRWIYDAVKDIEIRRETPIIVTKEEAKKFITDTRPLVETREHRYFELIVELGAESDIIPDDSVLLNFFRTIDSDDGLFLAIFGTTEIMANDEENPSGNSFMAGDFHVTGEINRTQFAGSAVFKEGKMIGKLTGRETHIASFLNNTIQSSNLYTVFPDPFNENYKVASRVTKKGKNQIKMDLKSSPPTIDIKIPLLVDVLSNHSMVDYYHEKEKVQILKQTFEDEIKSRINKLIVKTQEEFKGEPFSWSLVARKQFRTIPEYKKFDWMNSYSDIKVGITVDVEFGEFGRQSEIPTFDKVRD